MSACVAYAYAYMYACVLVKTSPNSTHMCAQVFTNASMFIGSTTVSQVNSD